MKLATPPRENGTNGSGKQRSPLRQRLVDVECGVRAGLRRDCSFFIHFFTGSMVIATSFVLGMNVMQWAAIILALTIVLTAQMFQQVLKTILEQVEQFVPKASQQARRIGGAAVFVAIVGTVLTVGLIFTQRVVDIFNT